MATAFGIVAIVFGLLGAFMAGWIGAGIAVVFGGLAIFFRIRKNNEEGAVKKVNAIVCGIVGIFLAILTVLGIASFSKRLKETADELGDVPYVSAGAEGFRNFGIIGFISDASKVKPAGLSDAEFGNELSSQLDKVTKKLNEQ